MASKNVFTLHSFGRTLAKGCRNSSVYKIKRGIVNEGNLAFYAV